MPLDLIVCQRGTKHLFLLLRYLFLTIEGAYHAATTVNLGFSVKTRQRFFSDLVTLYTFQGQIRDILCELMAFILHRKWIEAFLCRSGVSDALDLVLI